MDMKEVPIAKKSILEALEAHYGIVTDSCRSIGLNRSTFYEWLKSDLEFKAAVDEIQEVAIDFVEGKLFERIKGVEIHKEDRDGNDISYDLPPDTQAIALYLKTKGKKRGYVERTEVEHSGQMSITWHEEKTYETKDDRPRDNDEIQNKSL